jgi:hypothetical protein
VLIISGVVPFLTFFMLCSKEQMVTGMNALLNSRVDTDRFVKSLNQMVPGFVAGNFIVGAVVAITSALILYAIGMKGAVPLGIASGLLNLLPVPRTDFFSRVSHCSGPTSVRHTRTIYRDHSNDPLLAYRLCEFSFSEIYRQSRQYRARDRNRWNSLLGWLWGAMGLLLAVPLTARVKMAADLHPTLCHLSNLLALTPRTAPLRVRYGGTIVGHTIPYLRGRRGVSA